MVTESAAVAASPAKRAAIALILTVVATLAVAVIFGQGAYLWIKAIHVIAVISWMAGMLYLPRLFIYHCDAEKGSVQSETFKVMERRLLTVIMNPAMVIAWALGIWLAWTASYYSSPWFLLKLTLVLAMSGVHGYFSASVRAFNEDRNDKPPRHWRMVNEIPTVLMIGIVILVIVKPF
ncbi:MAG TPA: protoporphyrinogen oxidase HemJ [Hyphomicrobium sp.]|nr:protoporphyrinogen oxidase HemJ [Hyphomicrobium sp.]